MNNARCEIGGEIGDILRVRTAPTVDSLVFVSDYHQVLCRWRAEQLQQAILHTVHIVILVNEDVADVLMIGFLHSWCLLKQGYRFCEEIIEVQRVVRVKFVLIRLRYISDVCKLRCIRNWRAILIPEFSGAESALGVADDIP